MYLEGLLRERRNILNQLQFCMQGLHSYNVLRCLNFKAELRSGQKLPKASFHLDLPWKKFTSVNSWKLFALFLWDLLQSGELGNNLAGQFPQGNLFKKQNSLGSLRTHICLKIALRTEDLMFPDFHTHHHYLH